MKQNGMTLVWIVLIVPLWNWNADKTEDFENLECFNRTFMELKFRQKGKKYNVNMF